MFVHGLASRRPSMGGMAALVPQDMTTAFRAVRRVTSPSAP